MTFRQFGWASPPAAVSISSYRSLVYRCDSSGWEQQRARRRIMLADTEGYSVGPFVGGVLYDFGGFSACAWFKAGSAAACVLMCLSLSESRHSFSVFCWPRHYAKEEPPSSGGCDKDWRRQASRVRVALFRSSGHAVMVTFANQIVYSVECVSYRSTPCT